MHMPAHQRKNNNKIKKRTIHIEWLSNCKHTCNVTLKSAVQCHTGLECAMGDRQ